MDRNRTNRRRRRHSQKAAFLQLKLKAMVRLPTRLQHILRTALAANRFQLVLLLAATHQVVISVCLWIVNSIGNIMSYPAKSSVLPIYVFIRHHRHSWSQRKWWNTSVHAFRVKVEGQCIVRVSDNGDSPLHTPSVRSSTDVVRRP